MLFDYGITLYYSVTENNCNFGVNQRNQSNQASRRSSKTNKIIINVGIRGGYGHSRGSWAVMAAGAARAAGAEGAAVMAVVVRTMMKLDYLFARLPTIPGNLDRSSNDPHQKDSELFFSSSSFSGLKRCIDAINSAVKQSFEAVKSWIRIWGQTEIICHKTLSLKMQNVKLNSTFV